MSYLQKFVVWCFCLCSFQVNALSLDLANGESSDVEVYEGSNQSIAIIYMHGKNSQPVIPPAERLFEHLSEAGFTLYSAEMPWSRNKYRGTLKTANEIITKLIKKINAEGKRAVLMGHSMGATYAMIFAGQNPNVLAGVIPIALAHVPQMNKRFQNETSDSVTKAAKMTSAGKTKDVHSFSDLNKGESYEIDATIEYYHSFYNPAIFPDAQEAIKNVRIPTLWISGKKDRLTDIYQHDDLFSTLPENSKNSYEISKGKHVSVLKFCGGAIVDWLNGIE